MEAIAFLIVTLLAVLVFIGLMAYETYKESKTDLETKLSAPNASTDDIITMGKELIEVNNSIDEKELKWLELSE